MSYEDDIRREEARRRLEARQRRNGTASSPGAGRTRSSRSTPNSAHDTRGRRSQVDMRNEQDADYPRNERRSSNRGRRTVDARSDGRRSNTASQRSNRSSRSGASGAKGILQTVVSVLATIALAIITVIGRVASAIGRAYMGLVERFGWKTLVATAVVAILLIVFVIVPGVRGCTSGNSTDTEAASQSTATTAATSTSTASASASSAAASTSSGTSTSSTSSSNSTAAAIASATSPANAIQLARPEVDETEIDESYLTNILGDEFAALLLEQAKTNNDAHWIAAHPDEYLEDGTIVRYKMLRLAAKEPQAIPFVRDWPTKYCADAPDYNDDHTDESSNGVPRLYQWDKRWGYTEYSSTTFALTGCAPTSMAMVYQARTGDTSKSPYDMGVYAMQNGYATQFDGTDGSLFTYGAAGLGLTGTIIGNDAASLTSALSSGQLVVVNVGPGDFTDSGHYFVATGLDANGDIMINDPFSAERSAKSWNADTIVNQTKIMYAIS